jgi:hypothetical protein
MMRPVRKILFSAQKNEGPFLLEWIAYHKVVGFTDIIVCSNDCTDGSDKLLDAFDAAGEATHIRHAPGPDRKPQLNAAAIAIERGLFRDGDWVMWLDLDEFLFVQHGDHRVDDLIAQIGEARMVALAWRHFGDSGNKTWPGRHISDRFFMAEKRRHSRPPQCKTLFRFGPEIVGLQLHRPVLADGTTPETYFGIGGNRRPLSERFYNTRRDPPWSRIDDFEKVYRLGQVLHFAGRTPDLFVEKKVMRGRGYRESSLGPNNRHALATRLNPNEVEERGHLALEGETLAEMARLFALPGIADHCRAIEWFSFDPAEVSGQPLRE